MPRECGKIAQEQSQSEQKKEITAKQESTHREPKRATEERRPGEPERLGVKTQPEGRETQPERISEADTERRRDSERGQPERMPSRHRQRTQSRRYSQPEILGRSWGNLRQIFQPCPTEKMRKAERSRRSERGAERMGDHARI